MVLVKLNAEVLLYEFDKIIFLALTTRLKNVVSVTMHFS